jgi:hypothetical protein
MTPYVNDDRRSIDVSTGVTYPAKAERARHNPNVALMFSDSVGLTMESPPTVLVLGAAAVRDSDLQANTDRYVARSFNKLPAAMGRTPWFVMRTQTWYWARIWIEVTPLRVLWWQPGRAAEEPGIWSAPDDLVLKPSDPAPSGASPAAWQRVEGHDWRSHAARAIGRIGNPTVTLVADGWPVPVPATELRAVPDGFAGRFPAGLPFGPGGLEGPACMSFQRHAEKFVGQDNAAFVGRAGTDGNEFHFTVERRLGDFVLPGGRLRRTGRLLGYGRALGRRLEPECRRRGQPVPRVRRPGSA